MDFFDCDPLASSSPLARLLDLYSNGFSVWLFFCFLEKEGVQLY